MRQKITVRVIVQEDSSVLLVRRALGRESILGKYELPGGKLDFSEQPKDAARRYLRTHLGIKAERVQLDDVVSFVDPDDESLQYIFIVFKATIDPETRKIALGKKYNKYAWHQFSQGSKENLTASTLVLLDFADKPLVESRGVPREEGEGRIIVYSDGGSRGNPGPSAAGYVVMDAQERLLAEDGMYLGITTNNQAEYQGVLLGLQKAVELGAKTVDFRVDSLLVANQMKGVYKIRNRDLWPIHERIKDLMAEFQQVTFTHVRRERNTLADGMVNKILNEQQHRKD